MPQFVVVSPERHSAKKWQRVSGYGPRCFEPIRGPPVVGSQKNRSWEEQESALHPVLLTPS